MLSHVKSAVLGEHRGRESHRMVEYKSRGRERSSDERLFQAEGPTVEKE